MFLRRFWNESHKKQIESKRSIEEEKLARNLAKPVYSIVPPIALIVPRNNERYSMISIIEKCRTSISDEGSSSLSSSTKKFQDIENRLSEVNKDKRSTFLRLASLKNIQLPFKIFSIFEPSILPESSIFKGNLTENPMQQSNYLNTNSVSSESASQLSIPHSGRHSSLLSATNSSRRLPTITNVKFLDKVEHSKNQHQSKDQKLMTGFIFFLYIIFIFLVA